MSYLGVLFSLSKEEVDKLKSFKSDDERLDFLQEDLEEDYFENHPARTAELDKAWDAIHRSLTDGKLDWNNGEYPFNHVILGGEVLCHKEDYIMTLKSPQQVKDIVGKLQSLASDSFKLGYNKIDEADYGFEPSEEDFYYTWEWLEGSLTFWEKAAEEERFVLFTADR